jgi:Flp pilus assembly pilin Flp
MVVQSSSKNEANRLHVVGAVVGALAIIGIFTGGQHRGRRRLSCDDHGATAVEYALMVSLIMLAIVGSVTLFGQNVITLFNVPASAL